MKLDYLQFLELEVFTRFGTKLEAGTEAKIRRGHLLREILKQERLMPLAAGAQLAWLIAYNSGLFDTVELQRMPVVLQKLVVEFAAGTPLLDALREEWLARLQTCLNATA